MDELYILNVISITWLQNKTKDCNSQMKFFWIYPCLNFLVLYLRTLSHKIHSWQMCFLTLTLWRLECSFLYFHSQILQRLTAFPHLHIQASHFWTPTYLYALHLIMNSLFTFYTYMITYLESLQISKAQDLSIYLMFSLLA